MPEAADWWGFALSFIVCGSLPIQRPGLESRGVEGAIAPPHDVCLRTFNVCTPLWRLCAGDLRVYRVFSTSGSSPRTAATPSAGTEGAAENHYWRFTMFKATPNPPETDTDSDDPLEAEKLKEAADRAFAHYFPLLATNHRDAVTNPGSSRYAPTSTPKPCWPMPPKTCCRSARLRLIWRTMWKALAARSPWRSAEWRMGCSCWWSGRWIITRCCKCRCGLRPRFSSEVFGKLTAYIAGKPAPTVSVTCSNPESSTIPVGAGLPAMRPAKSPQYPDQLAKPAVTNNSSSASKSGTLATCSPTCTAACSSEHNGTST